MINETATYVTVSVGEGERGEWIGDMRNLGALDAGLTLLVTAPTGSRK